MPQVLKAKVSLCRTPTLLITLLGVKRFSNNLAQNTVLQQIIKTIQYGMGEWKHSSLPVTFLI